MGRVAYELSSQFGGDAYKVAAERAEKALAKGDTERAQFWKWVEAGLKSRGPI